MNSSKPIFTAALSSSSVRRFCLHNKHKTSVAIAAVLLLAACGQPANPHIAMCQGVAGKALGNVEWGEASSRESNIEKVIKVSYTVDGESGTISCSYPWNRINGDSGKFATSPSVVKLNGEKMSIRDMAKATLSTTKETVSNVAKETAKQTRQAAETASEKATDLARQAGESGKVIASEAGEKIGDAASRAGEVAGELGSQARELADEARKRLEETLQK